ncbi:unnamed protein product [Calicophoron daubneyi]|uniref:inositol-phosphate phosphatase n=1 Tax=Calicophoron daubneyi TaxID=300641 RepID=A0AAV2TAL4_CALDB
MTVITLSKQGWIAIFVLIFFYVLYKFGGLHDIEQLRGNVVGMRDVLAQCVYWTEEAGNAIKSRYANPSLNTRIKDSPIGPKNELLTDIDMISHWVIVSGLTKVFPDLRVISEEHPPVPLHQDLPQTEGFHSEVTSRLPDSDLFIPTSDLTVWVDPLDATQELTEGLLQYVTVMACVVLHGYPVIGVIHQPFQNRTYWAWQNYAKSADLTEAITDSSALRQSKLPNSTVSIICSRSHLDDSLKTRMSKAFEPTPVNFIFAGGSGYKTISLLNGEAQLYVHPTSTRRWDICAPQAVLEAVGGHLTGLDGSRFTYGADAPARIPSTTGVFATASNSAYNRWSGRLASLVSTLKSE